VAGWPGSASAKRTTAATAAATTTRLTINVNTTESMVTGAGDEEVQPTRRRRWRWWMSVLAVLIVLAIAAAFVRLPYETVGPGSARQVNDLVSVKGTKVYPPDGKLYYATVSVRDEVSPYEVLRAWLDPDIDVMSSEDVRGSISPERFRQINIEAMASSKEAAEVVALERSLGIKAATGKGALVTNVAPDYPAAKVLKAKDLIVAVDGKPVGLADDAVAAIRAHRSGDRVMLRIVRGSQHPFDVETTVKAEGGRTRLGVQIETKNLKIDSPIDITIDSGRVVGPSAGLAYALELIDVLTPGELTGGTTVAATGELASLTGDVGEVGGVAQKAVTVRRAGAEIFLVPRGNYAEANAHAPKGLKVIAVDSIDDALQALGELKGSNAPTYALSGPKRGA
jgi:PDZ domain-containing protein